MTVSNPLFYFNPAAIPASTETIRVDVCVYGGSSAGVVAALQAVRMGKTAVILEPSGHLGGLTSGGLSYTDFGNKHAIGGMSLEFYRLLGKHYGTAAEWLFEPHVAERAFEQLVAQAKIPVRFRQFVDRAELSGKAIRAVTLLGGLRVEAAMFIDASYEGDLMARAGVPYAVGREPNSQYGEKLNGTQVLKKHQFDFPVDPYVVPGKPESGLLPGIDPTPLAPIGAGDKRVQAYNFRLCLTREPSNRIPFEKPTGYDERWYELLARYLATGWNESFRKFDKIQGKKVDMNNHGAVSTDFIGQNHDYPEADYATREKIFQAHVTYQKGIQWFLANDPRVPAVIRDEMAQWGLPRDEFQSTGGWPHQLYIREARRMIGDVVICENVCMGRRPINDPVGLGSYNMDSHNCRRFVRDGHVYNEGDVQEPLPNPYPISFRAIVPPAGSCPNLAVPVCLSATHIAYGSARMEPVFMILAQSAVTAACLALDGGVAVQQVDYSALKARLLADGQILSA